MPCSLHPGRWLLSASCFDGWFCPPWCPAGALILALSWPLLFRLPPACPPHWPLPACLGPRAADSFAVWQARSERTDIATLLIPAITTADAGFYLCVATSPAGTAQARIQVVVLPGAGPWGLRSGRAGQGFSEAHSRFLWPQLQVPAPRRQSGLSPRHLL